MIRKLSEHFFGQKVHIFGIFGEPPKSFLVSGRESTILPGIPAAIQYLIAISMSLEAEHLQMS